MSFLLYVHCGINRIRLEFKVISSIFFLPSGVSINRIRLEFKDRMCRSYGLVCQVLIESDWNLKSIAAAATPLIPPY